MFKRGMSAAQTCSVLAHELTHELLHWDGGKLDRRTHELEVEAVAFAVCDAGGLDNTLASSDYLHIYGAGSKDLLASLGRIQDTATQLIAAIDEGASRPSRSGPSTTAA